MKYYAVLVTLYVASVIGVVGFIAMTYAEIRAALLSIVVKNRLLKSKDLRFRWTMRNEVQLVIMMVICALFPISTLVVLFHFKTNYKERYHK